MTDLVRTVLSRVLSQELGNQARWAEKDRELGHDTAIREKVTEEIKAFMEENNIEFRADFY